ncbi:MAG: DNA methyltransferase [Candidatus Paceibacterota bacterium]
MEAMKEMPDKAFDLAIVDPPYGIGEDGESNHSRGHKNIPATKFTPKQWDKAPPPPIYFRDLRRISINQIIFGANHFISRIPLDSSCWIVWDKIRYGCDFADCELAWTSFKTAVRQFRFMWNGMLQGNMKHKEKRIHPTQKPVVLYQWLLKNYAKPGDKILDTHGGSCSLAIACDIMGFDCAIYEIDEDYYKAAVDRFERHRMQGVLDL